MSSTLRRHSPEHRRRGKVCGPQMLQAGVRLMHRVAEAAPPNRANKFLFQVWVALVTRRYSTRAPLRDSLAATRASGRNFASKQCAEVRGELAGAIARLSSRANLVSDSRARAREVSGFNRTLILRLVEAEIRSWQPPVFAGNVRMCEGQF